MVTPLRQSDGSGTPYTAGGVADYAAFPEIWPEVFERGVAALERKGIGRAAAEDAVQEAGVRAFTGSVPFVSARDLGRWIDRVAWRIAVDEYRRHGRRRAELEDDTGHDDVASTVEGRLAWEAAATAWSRLSENDRIALTSHNTHDDRKIAVRNAVRRHRARARLVAYIEAATAAIAWVLGRPRRAAVMTTAAAMPLALLVFATPHAPMTGVPDSAVSVPAAQLSGGQNSGISVQPRQPVDTRVTAGPPAPHAASSTEHKREADDVVSTRPKSPEEPVACAGNTTVGSSACLDLPVRPKLSDLDDPVEDLPSPDELLP